MDSAVIPARSSSSRTWAAILSLPNWNVVSAMGPIVLPVAVHSPNRSTLGLRSFFRRLLGLRSLFRRFLLFGDLLFRLAPHLDERIDQIIDRLMLFRFAPHPDQRVQKLINRLTFLCH